MGKRSEPRKLRTRSPFGSWHLSRECGTRTCSPTAGPECAVGPRKASPGTVCASRGNSSPMGYAGGLSTDADVVMASWDDPSAFAVLFDRHARVVQRFVTGRAAANDIDDLVSETFVAAFRSRRRYDRRYDDARPWPLGIAANVLRHHYRSEARRRRRPWSSRPEERARDHAEEVASGVDARFWLGARGSGFVATRRPLPRGTPPLCLRRHHLRRNGQGSRRTHRHRPVSHGTRASTAPGTARRRWATHDVARGRSQPDEGGSS